MSTLTLQEVCSLLSCSIDYVLELVADGALSATGDGDIWQYSFDIYKERQANGTANC